MTFQEWWEGLGRSYNPEVIWLTAQIAMRERAANVVAAFGIPQDCDMDDIADLASDVRALQPE